MSKIDQLVARIQALRDETAARLTAAPNECSCDACCVCEARLQTLDDVLALLTDVDRMSDETREPKPNVCTAHGVNWCEVCMTDVAFRPRKKAKE